MFTYFKNFFKYRRSKHKELLLCIDRLYGINLYSPSYANVKITLPYSDAGLTIDMLEQILSVDWDKQYVPISLLSNTITVDITTWFTINERMLDTKVFDTVLTLFKELIFRLDNSDTINQNNSKSYSNSAKIKRYIIDIEYSIKTISKHTVFQKDD